MKNKSLVLEIAIRAAVSAGKMLTDYYNEKASVSSKESSRDIVSEADKMAEEKIIEILKKYDRSVSIITEEKGEIIGRSKTSRFWLIDPLDGTVNHIHHIPFFAVSIAYIEDREIQAGAIYAPLFDDIYYGARGLGVFKNQQAIEVENVSYQESLFAVSFSGKNYQPQKRLAEFKLFSQVNDTSRGCLRTGSAALNLAYLAEGRFNGCFGKANKHWDVGAGLLLAKLAGAKVKVKHLDKENKLVSYIACSPSIWKEVYQKADKILGFSKKA